MRIDDLRDSTNIEDRTGGGGFDSGLGGAFGGGGLPVRTGGGFSTIIIIILFLIFGGGSQLLGALTSEGGVSSSQEGYQGQNAGTIAPTSDPQMDTRKRLISRVVASNEDYWTAYFKSKGENYHAPTMVLFKNATRSACGTASGSTGPFYCPSDKKVYLDVGFFDDMARSLGARGDFAGAYVIAHEMGHHVQDEYGILSKAHNAMARSGENKGADSLAVRIELQADCLAGTWAKNAVADTGHLEQGDIEEAMQAANSVGDDRLQKRSQGYAVPDSFTHGTSEQRMRWFNLGFKSGNPDSCDTFNSREL